MKVKLFNIFCIIAFICLTSLSSQAQNLRVMVFAPHPDDDLIGCGGSIAKHIQNGNQVLIVYMTSGDSGSQKYTKEELAKIREAEALKGAKTLGVDEVVFLKNPDGYLEASKENIVKVMDLIREFKPHTIYLPHSDEGHRDHKRTNEIALNAAGRAAGPWFQESKGEPWKVSTILAYEVHPPLHEANYCEDITDFVSLKVQALKEHKSQLAEISYDQASEAMSVYRGTLSGSSRNAECFHVIQVDKLFDFTH
jgi:LmbE family N-acetylglucosaminyl deacetylase